MRNVVETRDERGLGIERLPSVGEFNYMGVTTTDANGNFRMQIAWPRQSDTSIALQQGTGGLSVAAITIDADGDTSPFSGRKLISR